MARRCQLTWKVMEPTWKVFPKYWNRELKGEHV